MPQQPLPADYHRREQPERQLPARMQGPLTVPMTRPDIPDPHSGRLLSSPAASRSPPRFVYNLNRDTGNGVAAGCMPPRRSVHGTRAKAGGRSGN